MKFHAFGAMCFARGAHSDQVRKYTGNPYADHLAEVAGIVASVAGRITIDPLMVDIMISVAQHRAQRRGASDWRAELNGF